MLESRISETITQNRNKKKPDGWGHWRTWSLAFVYGVVSGLCGVSSVAASEAGLPATLVEPVPVESEPPSAVDRVGPGWQQLHSAALISPKKAAAIHAHEPQASMPIAASPSAASAAGLVASASAATTSTDFAALAEALENDPRRIYQFVRNHIEYVPYYGALKGPWLTWKERAGNDFDQAALLVELLRAAGYTANYRFGTMNIPISSPDGLDLSHWLGMEADGSLIGSMIATGGIPATWFTSTGIFEVQRVWVVATTGSETVELDPAFKPVAKATGIDLGSAMAYNPSALLAASGGTLSTIGTHSTSNALHDLDRASLRSHLDTLTANLTSHLKGNQANARVDEIVDGYTIVPDDSDTLPADLPFDRSVSNDWPEIPSTYTHKLALQQGDLSYGDLVDGIAIPTIAGKKLSLHYSGHITIDPPPTGLDSDFGDLFTNESRLTAWSIPNQNAGTMQVIGSLSGSAAFSFDGASSLSIAAGASETISVQFDGSGATPGRQNATMTLTYTVDGQSAGEQSLVLTGAIHPIPLVELHLDDTVVQTAAATSAVLTLSIDQPYANGADVAPVTFNLDRLTGTYVLTSGFGGARQGELLKERERRLNRLLQQGLPDGDPQVVSENLNVIGQTWMRESLLNSELIASMRDHRHVRHHRFGIAGQSKGYFVDIKQQLRSDLPRSTTASHSGFLADALFSSAFEHSVLEALQGSDNPAVSTVKLFSLNSSAGDRFFLVTGNNFNDIQPLLQAGGYPAAKLLQIDQDLASSPTTYILPENPNIGLNDWSGEGYVRYANYADGRRHVTMAIGGGFNGGFASIPEIADPVETDQAVQINRHQPAEVPYQEALDPVDLVSGAYLSQVTDLSIPGAGTEGQAFTRLYDSRQADQDGTGLGRGWTHNYHIRLRRYTAGAAALGRRTPLDMAPQLVAAYVANDLLGDAQPPLKNWVTAALIAEWAADQIVGRVVMVQMGNRALIYRELPDGSFASPPSMTTQLERQPDGTFKLIERFGTTITFDTSDRIDQMTDIDGDVFDFTYTNDRLTQIEDALGRTLTLAYAGDELRHVTDFTGRQIIYTQTSGNLTRVDALEGAQWQYGYDTENRIETVTDPAGYRIVDNRYDDRGRVYQQIAPRETGTATYRLHYTDIMAAEEDPLGHRTTYTFDASGRTVAIENELGDKSRTRYDGQGQTVWTQDAGGNETGFRYDNFNNLKTLTNALNEVTTLEYDGQLRLWKTIDALNHYDEITYTADHRPEFAWDGERNQSQLHYFESGPDTGRLANTINPRGYQTTMTYDTFGYLRTSTTESHPAITTNYDNLGRLQNLTDRAGSTTRFDPDNDDWDERGLVEESTDALGRKTFSVYDGLGRLTQQTDRNGDVTTMTYTPTGKLDVITYPGRTVDLDYDSRDNLDTMTDALGVTDNDFDALNRLTSHTDPHSFTVGYVYDAVGNLQTLTYPDGKTVTYTYDALNRIDSVSIDWLGKTADPVYDVAGRLDAIIRFNGTTTDYRYDQADRLTGIRHETAAGLLVDYDFQLDPNGNREAVTIDNEPMLPEQLINATLDQQYNPQKNRLISATTGGQSVSFGYDNEGQLQSKGGVAYAFDSTHRLTGYGANQFWYDGVGNRLKASRNNIVTHYIYDAAGNLLAEADGNKSITRYYIHGLGLMAMVDAQTNQLYVYHFDGTGHTVAMTDADQAIVNRYAYDPYGRILGKEEAIVQPFTYVGQAGVMTEVDGLYYMRARYYDPSTGRFISEDPIGFAGGIYLYAYVGGNPISRIDPTGLVDWPTLALESGSFTLSTIEAVIGTGLMIAGGPIFPVAAAAVAHGTYGMANSAKGIRDALYEIKTPGVAEYVGESLFGEYGQHAGEILDMTSGLSGGVRGVMSISRQLSGGPADVVSTDSSLNALKRPKKHHGH